MTKLLLIEKYLFKKNISIENKVMDNFGNIVTPNNISDNGTYNSPTLSWNLNETKDNLSYDFTTKITILNINATYSGTVIQPLTKDSTRPIITADEKVSYPEGTTKNDYRIFNRYSCDNG